MNMPTVYSVNELQCWQMGEQIPGTNHYRPARPIPWDGTIFYPRRWKIAWMVLIGKWDAVKWRD